MGLITRSEAAHRLKLIASKINNAASGARDGSWDECESAATEAMESLRTLLPHLSEASQLTPVPDAWKPSDTPEKQRTGGLGYRGSSHHERSSYAPPPVIPIPKPVPKAAKPAVPTVPTAKPVVKPIVTPPPPVAQIEETKTFDLTRICGQEAWFRRTKEDPTNQTDWEMTDSFKRLPEDIQHKIERTYKQTGKPVTLGDLEDK